MNANYAAPVDGYYDVSSSIAQVTGTAAGQYLLMSIWVSPLANPGFVEMRRGQYDAVNAITNFGAQIREGQLALFQGDLVQFRYYCTAALANNALGNPFCWASFAYAGPR